MEQTSDKCDGDHATESCPYVRGSREQHVDAEKCPMEQRAERVDLPDEPLSMAHNERVRQDGYGECLFLSMSTGYGRGTTGATMRAEINRYTLEHRRERLGNGPFTGVYVAIGGVLTSTARWHTSSHPQH